MTNRNLRGNDPGRASQTACIDAGRVFDSCSDRDCCEDMRVFFPETDQNAVNDATTVRARRAEVISTTIDVEELPFDHGYYACDLTYYFSIEADAYTNAGGTGKATPVCGICFFSKKVILYGGEGSVKVFASECRTDSIDRAEMAIRTMPRCCVQVAEPVVLGSQMTGDEHPCGCRHTDIPAGVQRTCGAALVDRHGDTALLVTVGLFTVVQLVRKVQMLVPMYDYCLPCKECDPGETPCEIFNKMGFPTDEFFPPACKRKS